MYDIKRPKSFKRDLYHFHYLHTSTLKHSTHTHKHTTKIYSKTHYSHYYLSVYLDRNVTQKLKKKYTHTRTHTHAHKSVQVLHRIAAHPRLSHSEKCSFQLLHVVNVRWHSLSRISARYVIELDSNISIHQKNKKKSLSRISARYVIELPHNLVFSFMQANIAFVLWH